MSRTKNSREVIDYSHEVKLIRNRSVRYGLISLSWVFVALALVGVFLPVLPTTPFLILASYCYARSSPKFYNWIMNHPTFGPDLRRWVTSGVIARRTKVFAISLIVISISSSILFWIPLMPVKICLAFVGIAVIYFIASRPEDTRL